MNIIKNKDGSKLTLILKGRLDTTTAPPAGGGAEGRCGRCNGSGV